MNHEGHEETRRYSTLRATSCPSWFRVLMSIPENIAALQERIEEAAHHAGRRPEEIALLAVSKTHPPERIREAYAAGLRLFGENRVQEFAGKAGALADLAETEWHMIGHLQDRKSTRLNSSHLGIS